MIMDEVKTGFRVAKGGAQEYFGVTADLVTYAKAMGNGYPVAAFGGQRDIMEQIGQGVSHGGTFTGNRVSMAAANATLDILANTDALETVAERGRELQAAISEVLERTGLPFVISGHPSMFCFWFSRRSAPRVSRLAEHRSHPLRRSNRRFDRTWGHARTRLARAVVYVRCALHARYRRNRHCAGRHAAGGLENEWRCR